MIVETIPGPPPTTADLERRPLLFNLTGRAEIVVAGRDRIDFLHGLVTNDVKRLRPGDGCAAACLTPKGRMLADLVVLCAQEELIVDAEPDLVRTLDALFRKYVFFQQVAIENRSGVTGVLHVEGRGAGDALRKAVGRDGPSEPHSSLVLAGGRVVKESRGGFDGFDLRAAPAELGALRASLLEAGAFPADPAVLEAARIEAGIPRWGSELTEGVLPDEAELPARGYVSYTKGCYVGQETVARIRTYGHVNRHLVRLFLDPRDLPSVGAEIRSGARRVGAVTSAVHSQRLGRAVALGYVHRDHAAPGTHLAVLGPSGPAAAVVSALSLGG